MFSIEKMCNKDRKSDCGYALHSIWRPWRLLLTANQMSAARNLNIKFGILKIFFNSKIGCLRSCVPFTKLGV